MYFVLISAFVGDQYSCEFGSATYYAYCGFGGILSCGITHTAVVPLDLVKCRIQVNILLKSIKYFLLMRDWFKHITWLNILQLKLGNICREWYSPVFKTMCVVKNIWRIINTEASIFCKNMLGYLSLPKYYLLIIWLYFYF